jgi:hypothetical protein
MARSLSPILFEFANNNAEFLTSWWQRHRATSDAGTPEKNPGLDAILLRFADAMASPCPAYPQEKPEVTNEQFAASSEAFKEACELAGVKNTARQASKFRRKMGAAYKVHRELKRA